MKACLRELGAAAVSATGVTVAGEEVADRCLTVAAAASKAIMCAPAPRSAYLTTQVVVVPAPTFTCYCSALTPALVQIHVR